jgi:hypothetical protein
VIDHGFIHSIYTYDPNGIALEFSVDVKDIRRNPVFVDREPSNLASEGPEPQPDRWPNVKKPTLPEDRKVYPGMGAELF